MSVYVDSASMAKLSAGLAKLADVTGAEVAAIVKQQAGLMARDCMRLTPPFSSKPISESMGTQRKAGQKAIAKDVSLVFKPLDAYGIMTRDWDVKHGDIGDRIRAAVRRKDFALAEVLLNKAGLKPLAVIDKATEELHRQRMGRAMKPRGRTYRVRLEASINRLTKQLQSQVGKAKAGWSKAIRAYERIDTVPQWVRTHGESASLVIEHKSQDSPAITIGNSVRYVQDRAKEIIPLAIRIRGQLIARRAQHIERAMRKKLAEAAGAESVR